MRVKIIVTAFFTCGFFLLANGLRARSVSMKKNVTNYGERIMNGINGDPEDFSYLVQLQRDDNKICGGVIINEYWILTAAHCIFGEACYYVRIFPLSRSLRRDIGEIIIADCVTYSLYTLGRFDHDIGLVRTVRNVVLDLGLSKMSLPSRVPTYRAGDVGYIAGWGQTEDGTYPGRIRFGNVTVLDSISCEAQYMTAETCLGGGTCPVEAIPLESICTRGTFRKPAGACDGDFGGPLIIDNYVVGIITGAIYKYGRCQEGSATLHILVSEYLPWINWVTVDSLEMDLA